MSAFAFAPLDRSSVAEQVAKRLLGLVQSRNLKPGDQLPPERELALMMQVSRPSLREALRGLQILGVLKMRQGGGIHVSSLEAADMLGPLQLLITLSEENVNALYEARCLTEGGIARMAAERISPAELERLRLLLEAQSGLLDDKVSFRISDAEFHHVVADAAGNPFLARVSAAFYVLGMEYRRIATETPGVIRQSFGDHQTIVAALAARDADAAAAAMVAHMAHVQVSTVAAMAGNP